MCVCDGFGGDVLSTPPPPPSSSSFIYINVYINKCLCRAYDAMPPYHRRHIVYKYEHTHSPQSDANSHKSHIFSLSFLLGWIFHELFGSINGTTFITLYRSRACVQHQHTLVRSFFFLTGCGAVRCRVRARLRFGLIYDWLRASFNVYVYVVWRWYALYMWYTDMYINIQV